MDNGLNIKKEFLKKNQSFYNLLNGKRVCIVSGGSFDEEMGEDIDNKYDVVIRLNEFAQKQYPESLIKTHGKRCDILFREMHNLREFRKKDNWEQDYVDLLNKHNIKHVFFFEGNGDPMALCEKFNSISQQTQFAYIDEMIFGRLRKMIGIKDKFPSTGLICLCAVAMSDPRSIDIFGFNFYQKHCSDNIYTNMSMPNISDMKHTYHDFGGELTIFRDYIQSLANFNIDNTLRKILNNE